MKPVLKWVVRVVLLLVIGIGGLGFFIHFSGDNPRIARWVEDKVLSSTGYVLEIRGTTEIRIWPNPGVRLKAPVLSGSVDPDTPLITASELKLLVDFPALLTGVVQWKAEIQSADMRVHVR